MTSILDLSIGGVHEFFTEPMPDDLMARLNPQWSVLVGGADKPDNIAKSQALVLERRRRFPRTAFGIRWWHHRDDKLAANFVRDFGSVEKAADAYAEMFFPLAITGTWLLAGNEEASSEDDPAVFEQTVAVHTAIVRRANAAQIDLGVCCMAMGEPGNYDQYDLYAPLFKAMQDGRNQPNPVYHLWRPNTYFPHSTDKTPEQMASLHFHLSHRHQREGRRVAVEHGLEFPPMAFGEFNTVVSLENNLEGPNSIPGYSDEQWMTDLLGAEMDIPFAVYCEGDGLYDDKWVTFKLNQNKVELMIARLPRRAKTLIEDWRETVTQTVPVPTESGRWLKIDELPANISFRNIRIEPHDKGQDVGDLKRDEVVYAYPDAKTPEGWVYAIRPERPVAGWVYWAGVQTVPAAPPTSGSGNVSDTQLADLSTAAATVLRIVKEVTPPAAGGGF